jgi:hypothetical protein
VLERRLARVLAFFFIERVKLRSFLYPGRRGGHLEEEARGQNTGKLVGGCRAIGWESECHALDYTWESN